MDQLLFPKWWNTLTWQTWVINLCLWSGGLDQVPKQGCVWRFYNKRKICDCSPLHERTSQWEWEQPLFCAVWYTIKVMTNLDSIFKSRDITLPTKVRLVKDMFFLWSCMDVSIGLWRRPSAKALMLLNCGVGEASWESLGLQGDPTSPFWRRSALGFLWKEWC